MPKGLCTVTMVTKNRVKLGITRKRKVTFLSSEEDMLFKKNYPAPPPQKSIHRIKDTFIPLLNRRRTIAKVLDIGKFCTLITI